jgi:undecaprenyl diphosphate synthase
VLLLGQSLEKHLSFLESRAVRNLVFNTSVFLYTFYLPGCDQWNLSSVYPKIYLETRTLSWYTIAIMPVPHIAIIPDGNRRWAKKRGKPAFYGHKKGVDVAEELLKAALKLKIEYFTFWGCSVSNVTNRSRTEVAFLFKLFETHFKRLTTNKDVHENEVRITALGEWKKYFPKSTQKAIEATIAKTKNYNKYHLTFMLAYSGTEEMLQAARGLARAKASNPGFKVTEQSLKEQLYTKNLPPVDLVIRTGGEPHLSTGFMMWDTAEAHLYFTETMFPDFGPVELKKAINIFQKRQRRHGS